ncbi:MAG: SDR family oxidoreductase [Anaerolineae bacterium]
MDVQGKVAVVTGGAHRVGQAIALALAQAGAHVAITYNASAEQAQATVAEIIRAGVRSIAVQCDQQSFSDITRLYETLRRNFDQLDILINSAAIMEVQPALDVTPADWERVINTNLRGPFFIAQAAAKWMLADGRGGSIVNIADLSALHPWPSYVTHTISKSGVVAMTEALALALAPSIRVNAVAPGTVLKPPDWSAERWQKLADSLPLRRAGSPHDVADAVLYCLRSDFMTGQTLVIDGGRVLK